MPRLDKSAELTGTDVLLMSWSHFAILKKPSLIIRVQKVALQIYFYELPSLKWHALTPLPLSWFAAVQMTNADSSSCAVVQIHRPYALQLTPPSVCSFAAVQMAGAAARRSP
jgi:hypothetical protein